MLNYRVQTCLDSATYKALEEYMKENGYDTVSITVRKIITNHLRNTPSNDACECRGAETL